MNLLTSRWLLGLLMGSSGLGVAIAGLEPGDSIRVTLRGVEPGEAAEVNGEYRVGESGGVRMPLLEGTVPAKGLSPEQFARAVEGAYRNGGIYTAPAVEVVPLKGREAEPEMAVLSVSGQVRRAGRVEYSKGITLLQAIDSAGGRNDFGGRNVFLIRGGRQYCLDFSNLRHKNLVLEPNDSVQVGQKGVIDRWKGDDASLKGLFER